MATEKKEVKETKKAGTTTKKTTAAITKKETTPKKTTTKKVVEEKKDLETAVVKKEVAPKKTTTKKVGTTTKKTTAVATKKETAPKKQTSKKKAESRVEQLIAEQVEKVETAEVIIEEPKTEKKEEKINTRAVENEIQKNKKIPVEEIRIMNKAVFHNIIIGVLVLIYFILVNLGFANIDQMIFLKDLQVFSLGALVISIVVFETAYRKDSGRIAIFGIEALVVAGITLALIYIDVMYHDQFAYLVTFISITFGLYYALKSFIVYVRMKKQAKKKLSDIKEIIKK